MERREAIYMYMVVGLGLHLLNKVVVVWRETRGKEEAFQMKLKNERKKS